MLRSVAGWSRVCSSLYANLGSNLDLFVRFTDHDQVRFLLCVGFVTDYFFTGDKSTNKYELREVKVKEK